MDDSDELKTFLQEKDNESSLSFNSPSQGSIATRMEEVLNSYYVDQKRLSHKLHILKFWKQMETSYPELAELAKTFYSVPSTQVSVERLFSGLKFILSPYRTRVYLKIWKISYWLGLTGCYKIKMSMYKYFYEFGIS